MISLRFKITIDGDVGYLTVNRDDLTDVIPAMNHYLSRDVFVMNEIPLRIHTIADHVIVFKATRWQISELVGGATFKDGDELDFDICSWNEETLAQESKVIKQIIDHAGKMRKQRDRLLAAARKVLDEALLHGGLGGTNVISYLTFGPTINELLETVKECENESESNSNSS